MDKKWTHQMFVDKVYELVGDEFEVRSQYENNENKILMYHVECGREFYIRPADFKRRKRCSLCNGKFKKTTKQFKEQVKKLSNDEYEVLSEYINDATHVKLKHKKCGYEWQGTPSHFIQGRRCPKCAGNLKKTTEQFKKELEKMYNGEYELVSEYNGAHSKVVIKHNSPVCNYSHYNTAPTDILSGKRCPKCDVINRSGENHWKYNPLLTPQDRMKRDMQNGKIRIWRLKIFERDDFTCDICKKRGDDLNAHHLNSWDAYVSERYKLENGVTLCAECHSNFHKRYGYGNNTVDQYLEYKTSLV